MYGWNMSGYMGWAWLIPIIVLGTIGFLLTRSRCHASAYQTKQSALDILNERLARGEIDDAEYLSKKKHIQNM